MKKVNFYSINLIETVTSSIIDYHELKNLIIDVIDKNSTEAKGFSVIDLTRDQDLHYVADVFEYKEQDLMLRISCQKPSGSYLYRDYATNIPAAVLEGISEQDEGIELYTYAYLNYESGILSLVNQKGAPSHKIINYLLTKYNPNYCMEFIPVPNAYGIDRIYNSTEPQISQIEIEIPVPSAEALEGIFGWNAAEILDVQGQKLKATMKVSCFERGLLTDGEEASRGLIDGIRSVMQRYKKAKIRAKSEGERLQDYSFFDENFSYSVDIPTCCIRNGDKHYYTADELIAIYSEKLRLSYLDNQDLLKAITNR